MGFDMGAEPALSFFTWNLAMLARSNEAPPTWGQEHTEATVRAAVLEAAPDLVLFQELPRLVPYIETHDMVKANPESHQGNLATLVSHELVARVGEPTITTVPGCAILTSLPLNDDTHITIANVHLAPGSGAAGAAARLEQFAQIVEASPTPILAIIGDTNTRIDELDALAEADLHSQQPPRPTWNTKRNRFHLRGPQFTAYFTRAIMSPGVSIAEQQVIDAPVEVDGYRFYPSDHFGLSGSLHLDQGSD
ncbi:MAG: endonuclease/exonuclease/phosphatase family protein [Acidimicrobiales bacterium]